jgi:hypothetical protein
LSRFVCAERLLLHSCPSLVVDTSQNMLDDIKVFYNPTKRYGLPGGMNPNAFKQEKWPGFQKTRGIIK